MPPAPVNWQGPVLIRVVGPSLVGSVAMSRPPLRADPLFRNEVVRIADLTLNTSMLEGYEFSNCRIIGPAVLVLLDDVSLIGCTWDTPDLDALFWEVPPERPVVMGAVGVRRCQFSNCTFEQIGVAGPRELRAVLDRGFNRP
jgi:hypothetical protein